MSNSEGIQVLVRAALICVACDIPASRKVSGFVGRTALHACSNCLKSFPTSTFGEKPDYTGSDHNNWPVRNIDAHRPHASRHRDAIIKAQTKVIERNNGCRYSILIELPHFDVIRFTVIDPMHHLLLGSAKHMMSIWTTLGTIDTSVFKNSSEGR